MGGPGQHGRGELPMMIPNSGSLRVIWPSRPFLGLSRVFMIMKTFFNTTEHTHDCPLAGSASMHIQGPELQEPPALGAPGMRAGDVFGDITTPPAGPVRAKKNVFEVPKFQATCISNSKGPFAAVNTSLSRDLRIP